MLDEIWKDMKGYEGLYKISSKGRILGLERFRDDGRRTCKERMLKMGKDEGKKLVVPTLLNSDGELHRPPLFKLMIDNFGIDDPGTQIIYKDGSFKNCSIDNITFLSKTDNGFENEVWKSIPGYDGAYEISNYCRVWRIPAKTSHGHILRGQHLKPEISDETDSYRFHFNKNKGKDKRRASAWKLMCLTFLGEIPNGVLYKDGDPLNCKLENLIPVERRVNKTYHPDRILSNNVKKSIARSDSRSVILQSIFQTGFGFYAPSQKSACDLLGLSPTAINSKFQHHKTDTAIIKGFKVSFLKRGNLCLV